MMTRASSYVGIAAALLIVPAAAPAAPPQSSNAGQNSPGTQATAAAPQPADGASAMPNVTIQASRERELRRKVDKFVMAVVAPPVWHRSLMRWNGPICPLVVGLAAAQGEYILKRISQVAHDAGAQVGGKKCDPNLYVAVTATPDKVLKDWVKRDPHIDTRSGPEPLRRFLSSTQPIRVWYDSAGACAGSTPNPQTEAAAQLNGVSSSGVAVPGGNRGGSPAGSLGAVSCDDTLDTHLTFGDVQSITSVLIVADATKLTHVSLGQLAEYVSLVGLIDIRPDMADTGAPTILGLFSDPKPVDALTPWDRALLYALYHTPQSTSLQMNDMEVSMVKHIAP